MYIRSQVKKKRFHKVLSRMQSVGIIRETEKAAEQQPATSVIVGEKCSTGRKELSYFPTTVFQWGY
jgi:hypothetical protein